MQYLPNISYPDNEKPKLAELEKLFIDWYQHFANNASALKKHNQEPKDMVFDGFYPHYFAQKKRILFIGWETLEMADMNYIEVLHGCYRGNEKHTGGRQFHNRILHIAYGILNGMPEHEKFDFADSLRGDFATPSLSFAFMNISKLSNESGRSKADWELVNAACRLSTDGRNFIEKEIAILEPNIVIAMNLEKLDGELDLLGNRSRPIKHKSDVYSFLLESGSHRSLLIHSWHFAARGKKDIADYYEPICDAIRSSETAIDPTQI